MQTTGIVIRSKRNAESADTIVRMTSNQRITIARSRKAAQRSFLAPSDPPPNAVFIQHRAPQTADRAVLSTHVRCDMTHEPPCPDPPASFSFGISAKTPELRRRDLPASRRHGAGIAEPPRPTPRQRRPSRRAGSSDAVPRQRHPTPNSVPVCRLQCGVLCTLNTILARV